MSNLKNKIKEAYTGIVMENGATACCSPSTDFTGSCLRFVNRINGI